MTNLFNYIPRKSPIHLLTGATKLLCLIIWSLAAMATFDTRLLAVLPIISFALFAVSRIKLREVSFILKFTFIFMILNNILIFIFAPQQGVKLYGTSHVLFEIWGRYIITQEQLFYHLNVVLKYFATIPMVLLFVNTTNPSEFAASLAKIGLSYKIAYSVSLALRYIPDIQREYHDISLSQQARGVEMSKKENPIKRLKSASTIILPLIISSMDKIEVIANAMELRGFGKHKKRTWYNSHPFKVRDFVSIGFCCGLVLLTFILYYFNNGRYFNPFIG